jgi:hypothetical protein
VVTGSIKGVTVYLLSNYQLLKKHSAACNWLDKTEKYKIFHANRNMYFLNLYIFNFKINNDDIKLILINLLLERLSWLKQ